MNADQRADALLTQSRVHILSADPSRITAHIVGDEHTYLTELWVQGREVMRSCTCTNADYHPAAPRCAHCRALSRVWHPVRPRDDGRRDG